MTAGGAGGRDVGHRFRLALADLEALRRAREFLASADVATSERVFQRAAGAHREMTAISRTGGSSFERVRELVEWPVLPSLQWCRGFLAGIFDAEGSRSDFALRIANTDPEILEWTERAPAGSGLTSPLDRTEERERAEIHPHPRRPVRAPSLLPPHRPGDQPASGTSRVRWSRRSRISGWRRSSRSAATLPLYDITTGTGDFIANGVVSHNCFARPTHKYLDFNAGRDFEREIVVKVNAPELLRAELARPSWTHEHVALGTNTDPYQWVEGRYKLMPGIWEAMRDAANPVLGADQISAAVARPGADEADRRADGVQRRAVGADAGRAGLAGDRAALAEPEGAARGGGGADPGRYPDRQSWWRR